MEQEEVLKYLQKEKREKSINKIAEALKVTKSSAYISLIKLFRQGQAILIIRNVKMKGGHKRTFFFKKR